MLVVSPLQSSKLQTTLELQKHPTFGFIPNFVWVKWTNKFFGAVKPCCIIYYIIYWSESQELNKHVSCLNPTLWLIKSVNKSIEIHSNPLSIIKIQSCKIHWNPFKSMNFPSFFVKSTTIFSWWPLVLVPSGLTVPLGCVPWRKAPRWAGKNPRMRCAIGHGQVIVTPKTIEKQHMLNIWNT